MTPDPTQPPFSSTFFLSVLTPGYENDNKEKQMTVLPMKAVKESPHSGAHIGKCGIPAPPSPLP